MSESFSPLQAGLSAAGDGAPVTGRLQNMDAQEAQRRGVSMAWEHDQTEQAPGAFVYAYVDGRLRSAAAAAGGTMPLSFLAEGDSSVQLLTGTESDSPPQQQIDPSGRNALLFWDPSTDDDLAAYRIYNADTSALVDEVRSVEVAPRVRQNPDTGTGAGRISAWGTVPEGTQFNGTATLEITGPGEASWSFPFETPLALEFTQGGIVTAEHGVLIAFHDPAEAYEVGDSWAIHVGPRASWVSDTLAPGIHNFTVAPVDVTGNEGIPRPAPAVYIADIPDPVGAVVSSYDSGTGALQVTFTVPAGALGVRVYANFNPHTGLFEDYVATDGLPFADIAAPGASWAFNPGAEEGRLLFYLRPYNAEIEREDVVLQGFSFPPTPEDLGLVLTPPVQLKASALPGGKWRLEWDQLRESDEDSTEFLIYRATAGSEIDYSFYYVAVPATGGTGRPVRHYVYDSPVINLPSDAFRLAVRASDGAGNTTTNTDWVEIQMDALAPAIFGAVKSGPA